MTIRRKVKQWARRLRRKASKYFGVFLVAILVSGCANMMNNADNKTTTKTTTTAKQVMFGDVNDLGGLMTYLGNKGYKVENEMEIADLQSGYVEGRRFQNNGMDYSVYRFDDSSEELNAAIGEARNSSRMRMNVGGVDEEIPVFVAGNYLVAYPEGADISELKGYFQ